jgi:MarR family transcriptional regulator, negative regulator of the multidrug operon emrRAB
MINMCTIRTLKKSIDHLADELKEKTSLTLNECFCLCLVAEGTREPSAMAKALELSPSRITRILDAIEANGLVKRKVSPDDRRSLPVTLTPKGEKTMDIFKKTPLAIPADALAALRKGK